MTPTAILVSPAPVDGYPPVQHQARLLADGGYSVALLTSALAWKGDRIDFCHPGVTVEVAGAAAASGWRRAVGFISKLTALRRLAAGDVVEIAYDPHGLLFSDLALFRPRRRIAHFHECLQALNTSWIEARVARSARGFQLITVPDAARGEMLQVQLRLAAAPVVIPNYPLAIGNDAVASPLGAAGGPLEVVYSGSVGLHQKLDAVVRSVSRWPDGWRFRIIGNDDGPTGQGLKRLVSGLGVDDRVIFDGWVDYGELPSRLAHCDLGISLLDPSFEQWRTALGASNKRYEYMRAGLPQIGDMNPGVREMLEGQDIGACVESHDPDEIARVVNLYAADPARCREEGARARRLHLERYNYQSAFRPVLDWLAEPAARRREPVPVTRTRTT